MYFSGIDFYSMMIVNTAYTTWNIGYQSGFPSKLILIKFEMWSTVRQQFCT